MAMPTVRAATQGYNSRIPLNSQGVFATTQILWENKYIFCLEGSFSLENLSIMQTSQFLNWVRFKARLLRPEGENNQKCCYFSSETLPGQSHNQKVSAF